VISAFYFLLGAINLRRGKPAYAVRNSENSGRDRAADLTQENRDDEVVESAA
jgi:hypothetical protein